MSWLSAVRERARAYRVWLLVGGGLLVVGSLLYANHQAERADKAAKDLEAKILEYEGLPTAREAHEREVAKLVNENESLRDQNEQYAVALDQKPEVVSHTKWRTNPININMRDEVVRLRNELQEAENARAEAEGRPPEIITVPCDVPEREEFPPYRAEVSGVSAEFRTEGGNRYAIGEVVVFGGFEGASFAEIGRAEWRAEDTEFSVVKTPHAARTWGFGLGAWVDNESDYGPELRVERTFRKGGRWAWYAQARTSLNPVESSFDNYSVKGGSASASIGIERR